MEKSGEIFKFFRTNKAISVKDAAGDVVSTQFINKYERGESDIRFENLDLLLKRMNVTFSEFIDMKEDSFDAWLVAAEQEVANFLESHNAIRFSKYIKENLEKYQETQEYRYFLLAEITKYVYNATLNVIYKTDIEAVRNYLRNTEYWGKFEFFILGNYPSLFEVNEAFFYAKHLLKKTAGSEERNLYRYDAILHFAIYFLKTNELSKAKEILDEYLDYPDRNRRLPYIHTDLFAKYLLGLYKLKIGDKDGEQEASAVVHIFSDVLEYTNYANSLQIGLNLYSQRMLD